jgi:hypothetical protein
MLGAPGPVFIHARDCRPYRGTAFPPGLLSLPLLVEAWASGNRIHSARQATGPDVERIVREFLQDPQTAYLHVRHGEAGCHIASLERGPRPATRRSYDPRKTKKTAPQRQRAAQR